MQKCFLVSNKATQVREYLEHRSIIEVLEEHRSLQELDLQHLGIVDVDKFIFLYYATDDGDLAFRSDLNVLRQLLNSPFFRADEGIFVLVDCENPMLEDLIHSACRDTNFVGSKLEVIHHSGALTLNDVSKYIAGTVLGSQTTSSYKAVYIREEETEERERYANVGDGMETILPVLTDHYTMYKRRAEVEAVSSSRVVTDAYTRPQVLRDFTKLGHPTIKQWTAFLLSGVRYTQFENGVNYLIEYFTRVGHRCLVVDITNSKSVNIILPGAKLFDVGGISTKTSFIEQVGYLKCRYNQLGYVVEMLDNIEGVNTYIFVCDADAYPELKEYLDPLCSTLYADFVTHFTEDAVQDYLSMGVSSTAVFLSRAVMYRKFSLDNYKQDFEGQRVALFQLEDVDTTDFYECTIGGGFS